MPCHDGQCNCSIDTESIIEHVIDLKLRPERRLRAIVAAEQSVARALIAEVRKEFESIPGWIIEAFGNRYRASGGPYMGELQVWAKAVGLSASEMVLVNCAYELDHLRQCWSVVDLVKTAIGSCTCTTGLCDVPGQGMVHLRNLDWPQPCMGCATRLFRYKKGEHEFISVGFPGFVGVLSGMVPGQYSATINWAPPSSTPNLDYGPLFLLRKVFEGCHTYEEAKGRLTRTPLSTSVFYTLCGSNPGQGCVIERTADRAQVRPLVAGIEAQANHHVAREFQPLNDRLKRYMNDPVIRTTKKRRQAMLDELSSRNTASGSIGDLLDVLAIQPICNSDTVQRMVFCPAKGEIHMDRRLEAGPGKPLWKRSTWRATVGVP